MMAGTVIQHLMQGVELPRRDAGHACSRLMAEV
jgi:hypothetical protein